MGTWRKGRLVALTVLAFASAVAPAVTAQQQPKASIAIAPIILAEPMVETPIPIEVGPAEALPRNTFLRIKGMPPQSAFSDGHFVANGTWALPIAGLQDLKLTVPLATSGRVELHLTLLAVDGTVLAEAKSVIAITASTIGGLASAAPAPSAPTTQLPGSASLGPTMPPQPELVKPATRAVPPTARVEPIATIPAMKPEDRERAVKLFSRGDTEFAGGDVAAARLLYQRAADAGLPEAAFALAKTYDPSELASRGVKGLRGEPETARKWYEKARNLGASGVDERIRRLGAQ